MSTQENKSNNRGEDRFARARLADFIKMPMNNELKFECASGEGKKIIQRMRVKLSKLKKKARRLRRSVQEFKMLIKSIEPVPGTDKEQVILIKSESSITGLVNALADLDIGGEFEDLIQGKMVEI